MLLFPKRRFSPRQAILLNLIIFVFITGLFYYRHAELLQDIDSKELWLSPARADEAFAPIVDKAPNPDFDATPFLHAILDPNDASIDRLACPAINASRYGYLVTSGSRAKYFFVLNLRQNASLLPTLLGSILEVIRFLGPRACAVSIAEGNSDDGTWEILTALQPEFKALGIKSWLVSSDLDPSADARIERLAKLRNLALAPVIYAEDRTVLPDAHVVFINDVAACPDDMLELIHQRTLQEADMACGVDWTDGTKTPIFYDNWISRTMQGDSWFDIPASGSWENSLNLFWNDAFTRARFENKQPFQVYSCWNGAAAFSAKVIRAGGLRFRVSVDGEAFQGEPTLFCKDLWRSGKGKIMVVPSVNFEYLVETGRGVKDKKGFVGNWTEHEDTELNMIRWTSTPPEKIRSWIAYDKQEWRPWNEPFDAAEGSNSQDDAH